jgi:3-oxoacyl-[acyl-carrier-protein] synthase-3
VPNAHFEDLVDTTDEWIRDRTGIRERHYAADGEATSDLARDAAARAMEAAGIDAGDVELLVVATVTPDRPLPAAAVEVQRALGLSCPAFDLNAACAGFTYALSVVGGLIEAGRARTAVVVGAEVLSRVLDPHDRATCVLFGDGAGAAVLTASDEPGLIDSVLRADGGSADLLQIPAGGSRRPTTAETLSEGAHKIHMTSGTEVFRRAVDAMTRACEEVLARNGCAAANVDVLVPHQANSRIVEAVARRLGVSSERAVLDLETVGNTSAASIPIALDRAWRAGRMSPGDLVLLASFGAGLTWGTNLLRWTMPVPAGVAS